MAEPTADIRSAGLVNNGQATGMFDVFDYIALCTEHYDRVGLGADLVEKLFR